MVMTEDEKRLTAYHEAGHAIVALKVPISDPVHKATIIPRGRALGLVMRLPERDKLSMTYEEMTSNLAIAMGGRIAEEMFFGARNVTPGAQSDIDQATRIARAMVTRWGFSKELGTVAYGDNQEEVFLGHSVARQQNVSGQTMQKIDAEIRRLIDEGNDTARKIITEHRAETETLAQALLEFETLTGDEIKGLLAGKRPVREDPSDDQPSTPRGSAVPATGPRPRSDKGETGLEPQPT
jgi:cell division protease FtsH